VRSELVSMTLFETRFNPYKRIAALLWMCGRSSPARRMAAHDIPDPLEP
jgi:hypothetical protein